MALQYKRNDIAFGRGDFRVRGDTVEFFPAHLEDCAWRFILFGDEIETDRRNRPADRGKRRTLDAVKIYANSHYVLPKPTMMRAVEQIKADLKIRLAEFLAEGKLLEEQRLRERTTFDLEMITATGSCAGIENYSRYLTGRAPGEPPPTLFEYLPENCLHFVDESHAMIGQLQGMSRGDYARKSTLAQLGFRLPSCLDNRPLKFEEWDACARRRFLFRRRPANGSWNSTGGVFVEQVVRPTGLMDPPVDHPPDRKTGR